MFFPSFEKFLKEGCIGPVVLSESTSRFNFFLSTIGRFSIAFLASLEKVTSYISIIYTFFVYMSIPFTKKDKKGDADFSTPPRVFAEPQSYFVADAAGVAAFAAFAFPFPESSFRHFRLFRQSLKTSRTMWSLIRPPSWSTSSLSFSFAHKEPL